MMNDSYTNTVRALLVLAMLTDPGLGGEDAPFFMGLGDLPGGLFASAVRGVAPDGKSAVGSSISAGAFGDSPFLWTAATGMFALDAGSNFFGGAAEAVSNDGQVVVGGGTLNNGREAAFVWEPTSGLRIFRGNLPGGDQVVLISASPDGLVIVGFGNSANTNLEEAFLWKQETGIVALGDFPGGVFSSRSLALSSDGAIVVGRGHGVNGFEAFRWTEETGMVGLGDLPGGGFNSIAVDVSVDGRVVVGTSDGEDPFTGSEGFRWTADTGMVPLLDPNDNMFQIQAKGVSADGSIIVGGAQRHRGGPRACIWDAEHQTRNLDHILREQLNLVPDGWLLVSARDVSADGRTIVGNGFNPDGNNEAWIAYLGPPPCPSDVDGDGSVGLSDLGILLRWFGTRVIGTHDRGDVNFDGDIDLQDLGLMLSAFGTNCP